MSLPSITFERDYASTGCGLVGCRKCCRCGQVIDPVHVPRYTRPVRAARLERSTLAGRIRRSGLSRFRRCPPWHLR